LFPEATFRAPETAHAEDRLLQAGREWWLQRIAVHMVRRRDRHRRRAAGQRLFCRGQCLFVDQYLRA